MNTSSQETIESLNRITRELNRYIPIIFLILGTIGNLTNIVVFTRPLLRTNPCSIYFTSSSIFNFVSIYVGLLTPFLGLYNLDPTQTISSLCKIRFYLRYSTITLSTWLILFASIDRFLSTSENVNRRQWSSLPIAKRIVCCLTLIGFLLPYSQVFYCYDINQRRSCIHLNNACKLINDIILLLCNSGLPPILMVIFSIMTIRNVKSRDRMMSNPRRRDVQLVRILLIQVSVLVLFAIPVAIQKLYTSSTVFISKNALTIAIDSLINQISIEISYISNSTTFYIYSLTSKKYRQEVMGIFSSLLKFHRTPHANQVQPNHVNVTLTNFPQSFTRHQHP